METYDFQIEDDDRRDTVTATKEELREAGWFKPGLTELDRWLILWDLADRAELVGADG